MATVYLADDLKHERKVALKVLKPELAAVVGSERFLAEIKTTAGLQHPNILPLHDSGEADGFLFYVDVVALNFLQGVEIDYATRDTGATFVFNNVFQSTGGSGLCGACGAAVGAGGGCG